VLSPIKRVWKAGETHDVVEVITDKGVRITCTPNHRILLHSGRWVEAQKLQAGDRLRKIGRWTNTERSNRRYINHRITDQAKNGTVVQSRFMWEQVYGSIPENMEVHHLNEDPSDDRISNLELRDKTEHRVAHTTGSANPRYLEVEDRELVELWEDVEASRPGWVVTPWRWNKAISDKGLNGRIPFAGSPTNGGKIRGISWSEFQQWIDERRHLTNDNVVDVIQHHYDHPVAVFDMEVEAHHNFAVCDAGQDHSIIVHNSEYCFLDNTACNLASINLLKFLKDDNTFDIDAYIHACTVTITAQEIIVSNASYPTPKIADMSERFRPLGLGYANLGALLMSLGIPYDSEVGRSYAGALTAIMTGAAYRQSATMARHLGAFAGYAENRECMNEVILMHAKAVRGINSGILEEDGIRYQNEDLKALKAAAAALWGEAVTEGEIWGYRNSQATVLAPTGTISFMMDCDTTGIEPDIALVKYKTLVGGGTLKMVNGSIRRALDCLGYPADVAFEILDYIAKRDTIEGFRKLQPSHLPVFDCAFKPQNGERSIHYMGHIRMMAACQPFISGAISKTVNVPEAATVEEIAQAYYEAWRYGLKAVAIYRDNSKRTQPLSTSDQSKKPVSKELAELAVEQLRKTTLEGAGLPYLQSREPVRRRLPETRQSLTHRFEIAGHEGYLHVGLYEDGTPGELFITMSKEGSVISGLMDAFATSVSLALQYGVPLAVLVRKFKHMRFEPQGFTPNPEIPIAKSLMDYLFRWLELKFLPEPAPEEGAVPLVGNGESADTSAAMLAEPCLPKKRITAPESYRITSGAPPCSECGSLMTRCGACYRCDGCGSTSGCG
jgi:ribonucleotide reductase alpha subunit